MKVLNDIFILLIFVLISISICQECPEFCLCEDEPGNCTKCIGGHYNLTSNCNELCDKCPGEKCYDNGNCTNEDDNCKENKTKGIKCETPCRENGFDNCEECERNGKCLKCKGNKYHGFYCNLTCENCPQEECNTEGICSDNNTNCKGNLYKGDFCNDTCDSSHEFCEKCNRTGECLSCKENKKFGIDCSIPCGDCPGDGTCHVNGTCIDNSIDCKDNSHTGHNCSVLCSNLYPDCKTCHRNNTCTSCLNESIYGDFCNDSCVNCPGGICHMNGTCKDQINICDNNFYTGSSCSELCSEKYPNCKTCHRNNTCTSCSNGEFYGDFCNDSCANCPGKKCHMNGTCIDQINKCENDSFTGDKCSELCSEKNPNCKTCHRNNTCSSCLNESFYGKFCNDSCENCPGNRSCYFDGKCYDETSNCFNDSYTGSNCSVLCSNEFPNCKTCNRNNTCSSCVDQSFFGGNCDVPCGKCPGNGSCNINGTCYNESFKCENDSFTGDKCLELCSKKYPNCKTCDRNNTCTSCIDQLFYGDNCTDPCGKCPGNGTCNINGTCYNESIICENDSFTGDKCLELCSEKYPNCKTCDRNNTCISCFNQSFYGDKCLDSCSNCPGNEKCDINGTCIDQIKNCINDSYTGRNCWVLCSEKYPNCKRCDRNNTCSSCFKDLFFGDNCTFSCGECPGKGTCDINGTCYEQKENCKNDSFTGDKCLELCSAKIQNCKTCDRNNTCTSCFNETFYGDKCNKSCDNCPVNRTCYINGTCHDSNTNCFNESYTGHNCSILCSGLFRNCTTCDRNNKCLQCINNYIYGDHCENECFNCPGNGTCKMNGDCSNPTDDCVDNTYTGTNCQVKCNSIINKSNCKNCTRKGKCINCFKEKYYGDDCADSCYNCPGNCSMNGTCEDGSSLCENASLSGPGCNISCKDRTSENCKRCDRNFKCIECTERKYHGEDCNSSCINCSETGCNIQGYCHDFNCYHSTYGLGCNKSCTCDENSNDGDCGKFGGQCLNCKFGYFGKYCNESCHYKCQTALCCLFKDSKFNVDSKFEIKTNYKYIEIEFKNFSGWFEIDYNYGYPLTLFTNKTELNDICDVSNFELLNYEEKEQKDSYVQYFTNYAINSTLYKNENITIKNQTNSKIIYGVDFAIARKVNCSSKETKEKKISGVIGFGFFNSISNSYFSGNNSGINELNILSYSLNTEKNEVELLFGNLFKEQKDYVDRLTSCIVMLDKESDIQGKKMTCELQGIKMAKYTEGFTLKNAFITFSLGESSSLILGNNKNYEKFLKEIYFDKDYLKENNDTNNPKIKYFLYERNKINRLDNLGFVFNNFSYSYSPEDFFKEIPGNKDYKEFLIKIDESSNKTEFILGKEFLKDIKFTINNEEARIYFYAKNAEYSDEFKEEFSNTSFDIKLTPQAIAIISLTVITVIITVPFTIVYFCKERQKNKEIDYNRIN